MDTQRTDQTGPVILAFDTAAAYCAAAVLRGDTIVASHSQNMSRGQAEYLFPLLEQVLTQANATWQDLSALGVGVGPGNFTGIRIAVSAARGLALGLGIPAVGVSGCEARADIRRATDIVAIPAPRDQVYLCNSDQPAQIPTLMPEPQAQLIAQGQGKTLVTDFDPTLLAESIVRCAASRWQTTRKPPAPLYVRPADAAPSRDAPPVLLD